MNNDPFLYGAQGWNFFTRNSVGAHNIHNFTHVRQYLRETTSPPQSYCPHILYILIITSTKSMRVSGQLCLSAMGSFSVIGRFYMVHTWVVPVGVYMQNKYATWRGNFP
jgi:hypothetical protein